jgi:hypothetical protein
MVAFSTPNPRAIFNEAYKSIWDSLWDNPSYEGADFYKPILAILAAFAYALYILAYPPKHRKLSIALLSIPVIIAFLYQQDLAPSFVLCDTFGRFLYIWLAHMSFTVTILEYTPPIIKEHDGWRNRLRAAYKVLFCISPEGEIGPRHNYTRTVFLLRHAWKATYLFLFQYLWWALTRHCVTYTPASGLTKASFFRRLPESLNADELWQRFDHTFNWCIVNMCLYEAYHSFFAIFFVGCHFDAPEEWNMALFGSIAEAWSVRRYWGKHWHSYIYASFSGHTKVLTRKWWGMRRGKMSTRIVENTIVFAVSGLMHTLVRWFQDDYGAGGHWFITVWYVVQMVPIVIEGFVQGYWHQKKKELGIKDSRGLRVAERVVGYVWVLGWNSWSIAKYIHTRNAWTDRNLQEKYEREFREWEESEEVKKVLGEAMKEL